MEEELLSKTIRDTLLIFITVVIFLFIIASYDRSTIAFDAPEYQHAADASHGEEPKPRGHGR